jgi:hypothetical protein
MNLSPPGARTFVVYLSIHVTRMPHRFLRGAKGVFARIISATSQSADADYKPETGLMASEDPFSGFPAIEDYGIIGDCRAAAIALKAGVDRLAVLAKI